MAALKTGAGKSILAIIPSIVEKTSTTVLVVPLKSLETDYVRRLKEIHIHFNHYHEHGVRLNPQLGLVLVSLNHALTNGFVHALGMLNNVRKVKRICTDELHYCLDGEVFWQESLGKLGELRLLAPEAQIVGMSGTIPIQAEQHVAHLLSLTKPYKVIRTSINRPEIRFVREDSRLWSSIEAAIKTIMEESRSTFSAEDRGMIFVPYVDRGNALARQLDCEMYAGSRDRGTNESVEMFEERRKQVYQRWFRGENKWLVATAALSAGNDCSHVRIVIHAGQPHDMLGFIQEFSRGGRDGRPATNYIFVTASKPKEDVEFPNPDYKGARPAYNWAVQDPNGCIHHFVTSFCDLQGQSCNDDPLNQKCSVCQPTRKFIKMQDTIKHIKPSRTSRDQPLMTNSPPPSPVKRGARQIGGTPPKATTSSNPFQNARAEAVKEAKRKKETHKTPRQAFIDNWVDTWASYEGACPHCKLNNQQTHNHHMVSNCPVANISMAEMIEFRENIRYNFSEVGTAQHICMRCHCPTISPLHDNNRRGHFACQDSDLLNKVAHAIWSSRDLQAKAKREFKQSWSSSAEFGRWLVKKSTHGFSSNIVELFLWSKWLIDPGF